MDHPYKVSVFKVEVRDHCKDCVTKTKNLKIMLLKIKGVEDVIIDQENKTVTTAGTAHPETILEAIRTKFKEAKQLSSNQKKEGNHYEMDDKKVEQMYPMENFRGLMPKLIDGHVSESYVPKVTKCRNVLCKTHNGGLFIKCGDNQQQHGGFAPHLPSDMHYPPMYPGGNYMPSMPNYRPPPMQMHFQQPYDREMPFGPIGRQLPHGHGPINPPSQMALPYYNQHGPGQ